MRVKSGSGSGINHQDHIFKSLETILGVKILKFGSGMVKIRIPDPQHLFLWSFANCVVYADIQRAGQGELGGLRLASALPLRREHPRPQIRLHRHPRHRRAAQRTAPASGRRRTQDHLPLQLSACGRRRRWRQIPPHGLSPLRAQLHCLGGAAFTIHHAARLHRRPI
jgi:hypothetical protein